MLRAANNHDSMLGPPASDPLQRPLLLASSGVDVGTALHVETGGTAGPQAVSPRDVRNSGRAFDEDDIP